LLASPLGLLIGLSLGALGGGGSILAVPALVYAAGQPAKGATTTSLILVAITSLIGLAPHWRHRRVRWLPGLLFGAAGVGGSLLGSHWNEAADPDALLLGFSAVMFLAGWAMLRRTRSARVGGVGGGAGSGAGSGGDVDGVATDAPTADDAPTSDGVAGVAGAVTTVHADVRTIGKVLLAGSGVGLLTGFFGVGGGFVIVPALVLALGFTMPEAVGTSLLVIAINSAVALSTRFGGTIEWATVIPFTAASLIGVIIGGRLVRTHNPAVLQKWFTGLLFVVATYTAVTSALALAA
jgi:uncharacterized membrane protein YfcA